MNPIGYVVCEVNQASGRYERVGEDIHPYEDDARAEADRQRAHTAAVGRRERYALAEVHLIDEDAS